MAKKTAAGKSGIVSNHMRINWHEYTGNTKDKPISEASLFVKAVLIGRVGLLLLSCGTGAWRIRNSMNSLADCLGVTCTAGIGLTAIVYTCFDGHKTYTNSLHLESTGVNTGKLDRLERFVRDFPQKISVCTADQLHSELDSIQQRSGSYTPLKLGLAAAFACAAFTFLLGGGPVEMSGAFLGAGAGNYLRSRMQKRKLTLFLCVIASVALACLVYTGSLRLAEMLLNINTGHEAGYVCAMLFIIPGFPFITSGIDMAKLDMRSGLERLAYALMIIVTATITGWVMSMAMGLAPDEFPDFVLAPELLLVLRLVASFAGVFGFSLMFNSPPRMAAYAALIGAFANTLRLTLVDLAECPPAIAAFFGSLTAGLLASALMRERGYPRIAVTVPAIVIMVPGLYLYRGVYSMGMMSLESSASWLVSASLIILMLPLGLIMARIITDRSFRHGA